MLTRATRTRIEGEIRELRSLLTVTEAWLQQQPWTVAKDGYAGDPRTQGFRRVNFWRNVLRDAEKRLEAIDILD